MRDAALEDGVHCIGIVQMHRISVGRYLGKKLDIKVRDLFHQRAGHPDLKVFDDDRASGIVIQHALTLPQHSIFRYGHRAT